LKVLRPLHGTKKQQAVSTQRLDAIVDRLVTRWENRDVCFLFSGRFKLMAWQTVLAGRGGFTDLWWQRVPLGLGLVCLLITGGGCGSSVFAAPQRNTSSPQVAFINQQIEAAWSDAALEPADRAADKEWCRRVHLDLIGRIPTIEEIDQYLRDDSRTRSEVLVDRLLGSEYVAEYARHWANVWTTVLIGRDTGNRMVDRGGMRRYLEEAFSKNIPYDQFVWELLTATGDNADREGVVNFNGATNFLSGKLGDGGIQATAKTAQIFLGLQVQCTQCHNHPFNTGVKQNQFWELNSFFRQARGLRRFDGGRQVSWVELVDEDFAGQGGNPAQAEIYYELRNGLVKVAYPVFVDGKAIPQNGMLPGRDPEGVNRRQELARLIQGSPLMPKAIINRMWATFFGYGLTKPIDDFGDHNPPSHPELLDGLAERLQGQSYDIKQLMRWLVLSKPYSLSSIVDKGNEEDAPSRGLPPRFTRFYPRQMQAEQLYESLLTATGTGRADNAEATRRRDRWLSQFVIAFGTDEGDDTTTFNGSIPQVLMLFNGDLMKTATSLKQGGFLMDVAQANRPNRDKINVLFMAALTRQPSPTEVRLANQLLRARQGQAAEALQDIWWALLNSNEFILNH
jgi:hypothetical protein